MILGRKYVILQATPRVASAPKKVVTVTWPSVAPRTFSSVVARRESDKNCSVSILGGCVSAPRSPPKPTARSRIMKRVSEDQDEREELKRQNHEAAANSTLNRRPTSFKERHEKALAEKSEAAAVREAIKLKLDKLELLKRKKECKDLGIDVSPV